MSKLTLIKRLGWGLLACYIIGQTIYLCIQYGVNMSAFRPAIVGGVCGVCACFITTRWGIRTGAVACLLGLFFTSPYTFRTASTEGVSAVERQDIWSAEALFASLVLAVVFLIMRLVDWGDMWMTVKEQRKRKFSDNLRPYELAGIVVFTGYGTYLAHIHAIHQISTYGSWSFVALVASGAAVYLASICKLLERRPTQDALALNVER